MSTTKTGKSGGKMDKQRPLFHIGKDVYGNTEDKVMKPHKTIRIAVTGDAFVTELERRIIDTPDFQRLRRLKQLGTTYLVYPSAIHTRFEHSLGVLQMVEDMMTCIKQNQHNSEDERKIEWWERQIIRLAALLHDIGNIPFGHILEDETCVIKGYQEDTERFDTFLKEGTKIGDILVKELGTERYNLLRDILSAKKEDDPKEKKGKYVEELGEYAFMYDIVKNTVCADLLDYLKRDFYFCNLPLGLPDRFLRFLYIHNEERGGRKIRRLAIKLWKPKDNMARQDIISELVQLLENRYFLSERVYFHHAKVISSAMVGAAVWDAMHREENDLKLDEICKMGDEQLLQCLEKKDGIASKLAKGLLERRLLKRFPDYILRRKDIIHDEMEDHLKRIGKDYHSNAERRAKEEARLCDLVGVEPGDILIYCPDPDMNLKPADMFVTWKGGIEKFRKIDDELVQSKIISILNSHQNLWRLRVFVKPEIKDDDHKCQLLRKWCKAIFEEKGDDKQEAFQESIRDILREESIPHTTIDEDNILNRLVASRDAIVDVDKISRASFKKEIISYFEGKKQ